LSDIPLPGQDSIAAQRELFRLAEKECGLSIAVLAARSPLNASTMKNWRNGAAMPAWALGALGSAGVPDHLLSLVMEPFCKHVSSDETDDGDLSKLGREAAHFVADLADADADGVRDHVEVSRLKDRARCVAGLARKAAA